MDANPNIDLRIVTIILVVSFQRGARMWQMLSLPFSLCCANLLNACMYVMEEFEGYLSYWPDVRGCLFNSAP